MARHLSPITGHPSPLTRRARPRIGCFVRRAAATCARGPSALGCRWEEYYDYIYPDEGASAPSHKILEMAHKWKRQRANEPADRDDNE